MLLKIALIITVLIEIGLPLSLGFLLIKRFKEGWKLILVGAVMFLIIQALHVYFLAGLTHIGRISHLGQNWSRSTLLVVNSIILGVLAGLFEEVGRYWTFRYLLKKARSWPEAIMVGIGWGGIESILVGINVLLFFVLVFNLVPNITYLFEKMGIFSDTIEQLRLQAQSLPWYGPLYGAIERIAVIAFHLALCILILQCFLQARITFLFFAILLHSSINSLAFFLKHYSIFVAELIVVVYGLMSLWIIHRYRVVSTNR